MKQYRKIAIIYSQVVLLAGQVLANLLYMADMEAYSSLYPYIGTFFGFNMIAALRSLAISYYFDLCRVTKAVDISQIVFGVFYLCFPNKEAYNLSIQVIVGIAALLVVTINLVMQYDRKWTHRKSYR